MNAAKMTLTATILAAAFGLVLSLGPAPALADKPNTEGCHEEHEECPPGGGEDPDPTLELCPVEVSVCIADVGKTFTDNTPASQYYGPSGYIKIESNEFDRILETLPEGDPAIILCNAYDVLIFNWSSPTIKKLNWQRLLAYMACDGNVIVEDPRNVATLADDVSTLETTLHSRNDFPLTITLAPVPVLTLGGSLNNFPNTRSDTFDLDFVNKHIIFDTVNSDPALMPFLCLGSLVSCTLSDEVVGLYGEFPGGGRIVLTGPDNNFHGDDMPYEGDPAADAVINHYDLLFNEIDWLLDPGP